MSEATLQQKIRAAYGRGAHDARKAMEKETMTPAKLAQAEQSVNGIALKVLEATPKQEPWPMNKIIAELKLDVASVCAGLLHDCVEDTSATVEQLSELFAPQGSVTSAKVMFSSEAASLACGLRTPLAIDLIFPPSSV